MQQSAAFQNAARGPEDKLWRAFKPKVRQVKGKMGMAAALTRKEKLPVSDLDRS